MKTKIVKSKIVYPHLGIIDEVEEEVFVEENKKAVVPESCARCVCLSVRQVNNRVKTRKGFIKIKHKEKERKRK